MSNRAAVIAGLLAAAGLITGSPSEGGQRGRGPASTLKADLTAPLPGVARISGVVITRDEPPQPVRHARVRARNEAGRVVGTTITDQTGQFSFTLERGGTHYVELVDDAGRVLAVEDVGEAAVSVEVGFNSTTILRVPARLPAGAWSNTARTLLGVASAAGIGAFTPGQPASPEK